MWQLRYLWVSIALVLESKLLVFDLVLGILDGGSFVMRGLDSRLCTRYTVKKSVLAVIPETLPVYHPMGFCASSDWGRETGCICFWVPYGVNGDEELKTENGSYLGQHVWS